MTDALTGLTVPRLRRGVKLRFDATRDTWVLLAPEKAFVLDAIAAEILKRVDGARDVEAICADLAASFEAPLEVITPDVIALFTDLSQKGALVL